MTKSDPIRNIIIGIIVVAIGWVMIDSDSGVPVLVNVGWILLVGGVIVVCLSIYSTIKG